MWHCRRTHQPRTSSTRASAQDETLPRRCQTSLDWDALPEAPGRSPNHRSESRPKRTPRALGGRDLSWNHDRIAGFQQDVLLHVALGKHILVVESPANFLAALLPEDQD